MTLRLRSLLIVPYLLLLLLVAGLSFWLSVRESEQEVTGLAGHLLDGVVHHVTEHLGHLSADAFQPLYLTRRMLEAGTLSLGDEDALAAHLRRQVQSHPEVMTLGVGTGEGRYTAFSRLDPPGMVWLAGRIWRVDAAGERREAVSENPEFDPRARPWYQAVLRSMKGTADGEAWSEVYSWRLGMPLPAEERFRVSGGQSGISAALPLRDGEGHLLGVAENAITLEQLSEFLRKVLAGTYGFTLILDADGHLLAHSGTLDPQGRPAPAMAALLSHLQRSHGDGGLGRNYEARIESGSGELFLRVVPFADPRGIDWRVAVAIPEGEFAGAIRGNGEQTLMLLLATLLGVGLVGWRVSLAISRPVERLSQATAALDRGGWAALSGGGIAEVAKLGKAMEEMAVRLDNAFLELENRVEQRTRELSDSRRVLATLMANLPGMAYRCRNDSDWTMQLVSEGSFALTGYNPADLIDSRLVAFNELILAEDRKGVWEQVQEAIAQRRPYRVVYRIRHRDQRIRWVWEQGIGIEDDQGRLSVLEGFITDISDLKDAQFALERAKAQAEAAYRAKGVFLSSMSHEIRTPLNAILGFSDLLAGRIEGAEEREWLDAIRLGGTTLRVLIDDILELSRMEAGKLVLDRKPTDLRELARQVRTLFGPAAQAKGIALDLVLEPRLPAAVLLDGNRMRQILVNLVGNAVKFTSQGRVELRLRSSPSNRFAIRPNGEERDRNQGGGHCVDLWIEVQDTGMGIPLEDQGRIFEPFEQQAGDECARQGGTGLGLAIVQRLSRAMEGRLRLYSRPGEGSCFSLELQCVPVVTPLQDLPDPPDEEATPADLPPATLLVADDVPMNRRLLRGLLAEFPFHIVEAEDGVATLAAVRAQPPDLILLDMKMPGISGQEVARRLKADSATASIPIVAITALVLDEEQREIAALCDAYLTKPVDWRELHRVLARFLAAKR